MHHLENVIALHRPSPGQHLEQDQTGGEDIRTLAGLTILDVLGRHVGRRSTVFLGIVAGAVDPRRNAEIHDARRTVFVEQDIGGFEVAMDDALGVGMGDRIENRPHDADCLDRRQCAAVAQELGQIFARHVLENQVDIAVRLTRLENRDDIRMAQLADRSCLVKQHLILRRVGAADVNGLDRDFALQLGVETEVNRTLRPPSQFLTQFKTANFLAH